MRGVLGFLLGCLARVWVSTLRLTVRVSPELEGEARPWVLSFFHGQQLALLGWQRRRRTAVMVSLSSDGDLQARALPRFGLTVRRGSTSRAAVRGLLAVARLLRGGGWDAAFAVDGPRGPLGTVHGGALVAAERAGGVLVPLASASARPVVLARAWDKFEIPLPFARAMVVIGRPIEVAGRDAAEVAAELRRALLALRAEAEAGLLRPARELGGAGA